MVLVCALLISEALGRSGKQAGDLRGDLAAVLRDTPSRPVRALAGTVDLQC